MTRIVKERESARAPAAKPVPGSKERDRLLRLTARTTGLTTTLCVLLCLSIPGAIPLGFYIVCLPLVALVLLSQHRLASASAGLWIRVMVIAGLAVMALIALAGNPLNPASASALSILAGGSLGCTAVVLPHRAHGPALIAAVAALSLAGVAGVLMVTHTHDLQPLIIAAMGWVVCGAAGWWLGRAVPQTMRRVVSMSRAYRAERVASETEAQRRQGARLLHDTVLATLTLLAHSGVGVGEEALRQQAAEDAALLRQLRLGHSPAPAASGNYKLKPVEESALGNTLESVKQRFRRMGLEVNWHGSGQLLLPSHVLDAFLLALAECLENVRRHAQVSEAHVTITQDDTTLRAMVTDAGVGFDPSSIDPGRLGFSESIVARLRDVGGKARLFSSPGSGTTVVLEVPR